MSGRQVVKYDMQWRFNVDHRCLSDVTRCQLQEMLVKRGFTVHIASHGQLCEAT